MLTTVCERNEICKHALLLWCKSVAQDKIAAETKILIKAEVHIFSKYVLKQKLTRHSTPPLLNSINK